MTWKKERRGGVKSIKNSSFPLYTIKRLAIYLRDLKGFKEKGIKIISSSGITQSLFVTPSQFRKDLSYFGEFGKRGVGYNVDFLISKIENIFGMHSLWEIALVGVGRLGSALLSFPGFAKFSLKITTVFDNDPRKIGRVYNGRKVEDIKKMKSIVKKRGIKIGILCTPPEVAKDVSALMIQAGIRAILNLTPVNLKPQKGIFVSNVDMACELQSLIYFLNNA